MQALDEASDVVVSIPVVPDVLDDLLNRPRRPLRLFGGDPRGLPKIGEERTVEAVEHCEV